VLVVWLGGRVDDQLQGVPVSILSFRIAMAVLIFLILWFIAHQLSFLNRNRSSSW